jgi:hypothetical protein
MRPTTLALVLAVAGAACAPERTMIVVRVESDLAVPAAMDSVRIVVSHAGKPLQSLPFSLKPGANRLPLDVGLLSPSGGGDDVEVEVRGSLGSTFVVAQDAVTSFVEGRSVVLEMFLAAECVSFDCHDPNKTCTRGEVCVDKNRRGPTLPPFDPNAPNGPSDAGARDGGTAGAVEPGDALAPPDGAGGAGGSAVDAKEDRADGAGGGAAGGAVEAGPEIAPGCVPKVEDCYNGDDDDCDGLPDCADPDCAPMTMCVPRPSGAVGTTVPVAQLCPKGFAAQNNLGTNFGLTIDGGGTACGGCQCGASVTTCKATLTTYTSTADCQAATNGKVVTTIDSTSTVACPVPDTSTANVFGAGLSAWSVGASACAASGAPVRPTARFATSTSFCPAANILEGSPTGCPAGQVCMRRPATGAACVLLADASACPAGTTASGVLLAGIQDGRTCGACACELAGASCDGLVLQMGSDYSCGLDTADIHGGARTCTTTQATSGVYTPGYHLAGTPTNGTCKPVSTLSGTLTGTGSRTLCCLP